jgi:hypothetical protein
VGWCATGGVRGGERGRAAESGMELGFFLLQQVIYYSNTLRAVDLVMDDRQYLDHSFLA